MERGFQMKIDGCSWTKSSNQQGGFRVWSFLWCEMCINSDGPGTIFHKFKSFNGLKCWHGWWRSLVPQDRLLSTKPSFQRQEDLQSHKQQKQQQQQRSEDQPRFALLIPRRRDSFRRTLARHVVWDLIFRPWRCCFRRWVALVIGAARHPYILRLK